MSRILITGGAGYVGSLLTVNLEKLALPNADKIVRAVKTVCYK